MDVRKVKRAIRDFGMRNFYKDRIQVLLFRKSIDGVFLVNHVAEFEIGNWGPSVINAVADWVCKQSKRWGVDLIQLLAFNDRMEGDDDSKRLTLTPDGEVQA